jgi:hypothetical protein
MRYGCVKPTASAACPKGSDDAQANLPAYFLAGLKEILTTVPLPTGLDPNRQKTVTNGVNIGIAAPPPALLQQRHDGHRIAGII